MGEVTDGGLKFLVGLIAKCTSLYLPGICTLTTMYKACCVPD